MFRPLVPALIVAALAATPLPLEASGGGRTAVVTTNADAGPGSFRAAVVRANADPAVTRIEFGGRARLVALATTVEFTGTQPLTIDGNGATIDGGAIAAGAAFRATGGGDLALVALTVRRAPAEGVDVQVPLSATGTVRVWLGGVTIADNKGHGVLINDQVDSSTTDGVQPNDAGSDASIAVAVTTSRFLRNGFSVSDRDGLRVNEGGAGDLTFASRFLEAEANAADGVEIDERGAGDVRLDVWSSRFTRNGAFDPADLDDGFDIDEYNDGSIVGLVALTSANDNYEEGFDFNENNLGDLRVNLAFVDVSRNGEEGIDYEEDDDFAGGGDLVTVMYGVRTNGNGVNGGDAGLKIREKGVGELQATVTGAEASENLTAGVSIREDNVGSLVATLNSVKALSNAGHGIDFDENRASTSDSGNLSASVTGGAASNNGGAGIRADQQTPGTGNLVLTGVELLANVGGPTTGGGVTITVVP